MIADRLLERLQRVKRVGDAKWTALCPAHADKSPSLSVRELDGERVLVKCWSGCSAEAILQAVGLTFVDLYPERAPDGHAVRGERKPWTARDAVRALRAELYVALILLADIATGRPFADADRVRAGVARERIVALLRELGDD